MSRYLLSAVILAAALAATATNALARKQLRRPVSEEDFKPIVEALLAEAEQFVKATNDKGPTLSRAVGNLEYVPAAAPALAKALATPHDEPLVRLYVAYQLAQPLLMAGDETLRKLRAVMTDLLEKDCRYLSMPRLSPTVLRQLREPSDKLPPDQRERTEKRRQEARRKKRDAEQAVVRHNRTVAALAATLKKLLVFMGEDDADELLLRQLVREEAARRADYQATLGVIRDQAVRMKGRRAQLYYDRLKEIVKRAGGVHRKKRYVDPARPKYSQTANSGFDSVTGDFVVEVAKTVNLMATSAKQPAIKVPGEKIPGKKKKEPRPRRR